jgi:hypothetical protein
VRNFLIIKGFWKLLFGGLLGGLISFAYYYFIGCATGSCPIQSNPVLMTGYGMLFGAIMGFPGKKESDKNLSNDQPIKEGN